MFAFIHESVSNTNTQYFEYRYKVKAQSLKSALSYEFEVGYIQKVETETKARAHLKRAFVFHNLSNFS